MYNTLVRKVNAIDTKVIGNYFLEQKIFPINKNFDLVSHDSRVTGIKNKIPDITNLANKAALTQNYRD